MIKTSLHRIDSRKGSINLKKPFLNKSQSTTINRYQPSIKCIKSPMKSPKASNGLTQNHIPTSRSSRSAKTF